MLDFLTRKPGLYETILDLEWREWFEDVALEDILDLLLRQDLSYFDGSHRQRGWRGHECPPVSLVEYIRAIRRHSLQREVRKKTETENLPRHLAVGMRPKKIHEVIQFAAFVNDLSNITDDNFHAGVSDSVTNGQHKKSSVIVDFGSGQNYLGRTLTCPPYDKHVIAIEQRPHNVEGAKSMDIHAKLAEKEKKIINKKTWKQQWTAKKQKDLSDRANAMSLNDGCTPQKDVPDIDWNVIEEIMPPTTAGQQDAVRLMRSIQAEWQTDQLLVKEQGSLSGSASIETPSPATSQISNQKSAENEKTDTPTTSNKIVYVEKELSNGDLTGILPESNPAIVVSIHSCGNLTHHGLRSITLNPAVKAVAMVGCCYNLMTERLGPPTYKLPNLRSNHPRLEETMNAFDAHGFPMSRRLEQHTWPVMGHEPATTAQGIRLNITARMMAVQAPHNWGAKDSEEFFTKHYYRALLQRILLDLGIVKMSSAEHTPEIECTGASLSGKNETGAPLIIGTLRKSCFKSFQAYVHGAVEKLTKDPIDGEEVRQKTFPLFENDDKLIHEYERGYHYAKKELSVIWSLMAFSANVVESTIIVDRWLWLREQEVVERAWVEAVFDYGLSPRNMVIVGMKKRDC